MPTVEASIEAALFARAKGLSVVPASSIAWPNRASLPSLGKYLRVTHVPNRSNRFLIAGSDPHQRMGLLQIDVFAEKNAGPATATELAGQVAAHFPADLELNVDGLRVRISKAPDVGQALPDDTHWMVPVIISYEVYA